MPIVSAEYDFERNASILYDQDGNPTISQVRGGICFPTAIKLQGKDNIMGFILIASRDTQGLVSIWEEQKFLVIENIVGPDCRIKYQGITNFFNNGWSRYFNIYYYWSQPFATAKQYRMQIADSQRIEPKPRLVDVDLAQDEDAYLTIWRLYGTKQLTYTRGGPLHRALKRYKADREPDPAVHALHCLLAGFNKHRVLEN